MKKSFKILSTALIIGGALLFTACTKEDAVTKKEVPTASEQQSDDSNAQSEASDEADDVATNSFTGSNLRVDGQAYRGDTCNMTRAVVLKEKTITFTFNGKNCAGTRTRTGSISAKVISTSKFGEPGGKIELTFTNFKVVRESDQKSITLNGKKIITNVSGYTLPSIQTIHGSLSLKFDNSTERTWKIARKRTISIDNNIISWKVESDSTGYIVEGGVNRDGKNFVTTIPSAIVVNGCGVPMKAKAVSGESIYTVGDASLSLKFGYKSLTEIAQSCDATGMLITYTDPTTIATKYVSYK